MRNNNLTFEVPVNYPLAKTNFSLSEKLDKFFAVENAGIECEPKCPKCLCRNCPESDHNMKEERELAIIENGLRYDAGKNVWVSNYPWLKNPQNLIM